MAEMGRVLNGETALLLKEIDVLQDAAASDGDEDNMQDAKARDGVVGRPLLQLRGRGDNGGRDGHEGRDSDVPKKDEAVYKYEQDLNKEDHARSGCARGCSSSTPRLPLCYLSALGHA